MSYRKIFAKNKAEKRVEYYKDEACTILHREDGPAVKYKSGRKEWWINGLRHREGGPARKWEYGSKEWFINGKYHREDGPAFIYHGGYKCYYLNGILYSKKEYWTIIKFGDFI